MALSAEELEHARTLLQTNERVLRIREHQIAKHGDETPAHIILDAEDIRKKILALKAILEPELPDEISGLVKRRLEDDYFIFQQTLSAKQDVALLREDVIVIKQSQSLAAIWRMQTDDWKTSVNTQLSASERKRASGAMVYRALLLILALGVLLNLALIVALALR